MMVIMVIGSFKKIFNRDGPKRLADKIEPKYSFSGIILTRLKLSYRLILLISSQNRLIFLKKGFDFNTSKNENH